MITTSHQATILRECLEAMFFLVFIACTVFKVWQGVNGKQQVGYQSRTSKARKNRLFINTIYAVSWLGMMITLLLGKIGN
jgi:hypothetical protein